MKREQMLARVEARTTPWDMVIIGGGATGIGIAVDAATRGYQAGRNLVAPVISSSICSSV